MVGEHGAEGWQAERKIAGRAGQLAAHPSAENRARIIEGGGHLRGFLPLTWPTVPEPSKMTDLGQSSWLHDPHEL